MKTLPIDPALLAHLRKIQAEMSMLQARQQGVLDAISVVQGLTGRWSLDLDAGVLVEQQEG